MPLAPLVPIDEATSVLCPQSAKHRSLFSFVAHTPSPHNFVGYCVVGGAEGFLVCIEFVASRHCVQERTARVFILNL